MKEQLSRNYVIEKFYEKSKSISSYEYTRNVEIALQGVLGSYNFSSPSCQQRLQEVYNQYGVIDFIRVLSICKKNHWKGIETPYDKLVEIFIDNNGDDFLASMPPSVMQHLIFDEKVEKDTEEHYSELEEIKQIADDEENTHYVRKIAEEYPEDFMLDFLSE